VATRHWLTNAAAPYTPTTRRGSWTTASGEDVQLLGRKPQGSAGTSSIALAAGSGTRKVLLHRSISAGAIKAGTISGTVTWCIGAKESNTLLDAVWHLHVYVTSGDSDTPRGTLLSNYTGSSEFSTTATGATEGAVSVSPVSVQVGDRLVVEIGYETSTTTAASYSATINYGNVGSTDLAATDTAVTTEPGWIEFSGADGLFTAAFTGLTDTFTSSIDAKWTSTGSVTATGGRARMPCTTTLATLYTATPYEIQGAQVAFQVPTLPGVGGGSGAAFSAYLSAGPTVSTTNLEINYQPGTGNLVFRSNIGGADASPTTIAYNSTSHQWWRFRESGGSILMETSPDNSSWTTQRTVTVNAQWMRLGTLIFYAECQRSSGTNDFAELDNFNISNGRTQAVTGAGETDAAQTLGRAKTSALVLAAATDTAQPIARTKRAALGTAGESGTAQPAGRAKGRALSLAAALEVAQRLARSLGVLRAAGSDAAQPLGAAKSAPLGPAGQTDSARPVGAAKARTVGTAASGDTARPITAAHVAPAATSSSVETARPVGAVKRRTAAPATENAAALAPAAAKTRAAAPATATDTARPAAAAKTRALGTGTETDTAGTLATPGHVTQPLQPATESSAAQPIAARKTAPIAPATAADLATVLRPGKARPLGAATEQDSALPPAAGKARTLPPATAVDSAQPTGQGRVLPLASATETHTAQPLHPAKARPLLPATETDTAQPIATPGGGQAHGLRIAGRPESPWTAQQAGTAWTARTAHTAWSTPATPGGDMHSLSTEFQQVPIACTSGDPTAYPVQMAVVPVGHEPDDADWHTATWGTDSAGQTVAKLLVGPDGGAVAPGPGRYRAWVAIDAPPEHPVLDTPPFEIS
jgi:hypothetical protein